MTRKEVEEIIRRAFEVDRMLPYPKPKRPQCPIGKMVIIPDTRNVGDIDPKEFDHITQEDMRIWDMVMFDWMPLLHGAQKAVVKYRCCGMGWKRIARTLEEKKITYRVLDRTTLWRMFQQGLDEFVVFDSQK